MPKTAVVQEAPVLKVQFWWDPIGMFKIKIYLKTLCILNASFYKRLKLVNFASEYSFFD